MSELNTLNLEPRLEAIMQQEYPRFSDAEYARRHKLLDGVMQKAGVDHLLVVTDHRVGNAPQWVTSWPGTVEAYVVFKPGVKMTMFMEWYNHFPLGKKIARDIDVQWGEHQGIQKTIAELKRRGAKRVGVMGPLVVSKWRMLEQHFEMVGLDAEYIRLRTIKSEEFDTNTCSTFITSRGLCCENFQTPEDLFVASALLVPLPNLGTPPFHTDF